MAQKLIFTLSDEGNVLAQIQSDQSTIPHPIVFVIDTLLYEFICH